MGERADFENQLTVAWELRGVDTALEIGERGTIAAPISATRRSFDLDLPLLLSTEGGGEAPFRMGATLGEGGMGIVRAAHQLSLDRAVAVKTLRTEIDDERAIASLLREARVTGTLEHPHIVPIHALGRDEGGRPMIVMKRVDGRSWRELLDAGKMTLDEHLDVLIAVARTVHFAHDKGVLHRDLKPDNVMLGEFDEIYLVDWGVAVALEGCAVRDLPLARDARHVAGTPQYMAPEMAAGAGEFLGPATDVYLLGAVLHELITGAPPHLADTVMEMLGHAFASDPPSYDDDVPEELAAICRRAMDVDPEERFDDAASFAAALSAYRQHQSAAKVSSEAWRSLEQLLRAIDEGAARERIHATFSACRFGFTQALSMWPGNDEARRGLRRACERMIAFELEHGSALAAETLLAELDDAEPELERRVRSATDEERRRDARIQQLEQQHDPTIGDIPRGRYMVVAAVLWLAGGFGAGYAHRNGSLSFGNLDAAALLFAGMVGTTVLVARGRDHVYATTLQRQVVSSVLMMLATSIALFTIAHYIHMTLAQAVAMLYLVSIAATAIVTRVADPRMWPMPAILTAGMVLHFLWPTYFLEFLSVSMATARLALAYVWRRR
jgi:serine/threonine-protein kinase